MNNIKTFFMGFTASLLTALTLFMLIYLIDPVDTSAFGLVPMVFIVGIVLTMFNMDTFDKLK